jgi:hypothetical protein
MTADLIDPLRVLALLLVLTLLMLAIVVVGRASRFESRDRPPPTQPGERPASARPTEPGHRETGLHALCVPCGARYPLAAAIARGGTCPGCFGRLVLLERDGARPAQPGALEPIETTGRRHRSTP